MLLYKFFLLKYLTLIKYIIMKLLKISLLFITTFTFIACGGGSSGGDTIVVVSGTPAPKTSLSITDATGDEGKNITFRVTVNRIIAKPITFNYRVVFDNSTDSANASDFEGAIAGSSTIATNDSSTTIEIGIFDDSLREGAETFVIFLSNLTPTDLIFTKNIATGTIVKNDSNGLNTITITNARGEEGSRLNFQVTAGATITEQISFQFEATLDNNATNPANISELSGELTGTRQIATNDNSTTISILTSNDILREANETFLVILSNLTPTDTIFIDNVGRGTILDNDNNAAGIVRISVADAEASEASSSINFRVSSKFSAISPFTFDYEAVLDNPISASTDDFTATSGTATIPVGSDSTTISVLLTRDKIAEPDETFSLRLTNPSANVMLARTSAKGKILNDDLGEISNATAIVGDSQIILSWTNPNSNLFAGVTIAQTTGATAPADCSSGRQLGEVTSDTINLPNDIKHSFRICARSISDNLSGGKTLINLTPRKADKDGNGLIEIATATELYNIRHNLDATSYKTSSTAVGNIIGCPVSGCRGYELTANIDLSGDWEPIGSNSDNDRFTAIFDGTDKTISNLRITGNNSNVGLFSTIQDATISNLKLADIKITGNGNVGALVGSATDTTLSNIELIGDESQTEITSNGSNVGGLVGDFTGAITDASSSLTVRRHNSNTIANTGGLVGRLAGSIKNSNSSGFVSSSGPTAGGLVGQLRTGATISNSWASGGVTKNGRINNQYGGLVGNNNGAISNSWASGEVAASNIIGGLVGRNSGTISNSWASGEVTSGGSGVGGLAGNNDFGTIWNSWASGQVIGSGVGGLIGGISSGTRQGRNYRFSNEGNSFGTLLDNATTDLANLSGASGSATTDSNWHAGFGDIVRNRVVIVSALFTRFCDTDGSTIIEPDEQMADNSVWVMPPATSDNVTTNTNEANQPANYYQIPAIRCIANTEGTTDTAEIDRLRKIEIDRQRHKFPQP